MSYRDDINKNLNQKLVRVKDNLPPFVNDFLASKENSKEKSTVLQYGYDIEKFLYFMMETGRSDAEDTSLVSLEEVGHMKPKDIDAYMNYLTEYIRNGEVFKNKDSAKHRKLAALSALYYHLTINDLIDKNPIAKVEAPKKHKKTIIVLDDEQVAKLFKVIRSDEGFKGVSLARHQKEKYRDEAIMMFLLGTGVRISELVGLDISDIDLHKQKARIVKKGGDEETVYFGDDVKESLIRYLSGDENTPGSRASFKPQDTGTNALFVSRQHNRYAVRSIQTLVKKYAEIALGDNNHISPHKMRSTFGTNLYKDTGDIELVSKALGHKSILMASERYVDFPEDRKREAASKRRVIKGE